MEIIVCTLFEGNYHYGVATLINSLYIQGFKGNICIGYKGNLPKWARCLETNNEILKDCDIQFIKLHTDYHLTNYKPDFMLKLLENSKKPVDSIFYFDPDIVLTAPWHFMEDWVQCGIAVCEDVLSPLEEFHPRRKAWRNYFAAHNFQLSFKNSIYVNGGFIGLCSGKFEFLNLWKSLQEAMSIKIGGLTVSSLTGNTLPKEEQGSFAYFSKTDQDALNATIEAFDSNISFMRKDAMGFDNGRVFLPHALGHPKPWDYNPFSQALNGKTPSKAVIAYWKYVNFPIVTHSSFSLKRNAFLLKINIFLGRFYRRSNQ